MSAFAIYRSPVLGVAREMARVKAKVKARVKVKARGRGKVMVQVMRKLQEQIWLLTSPILSC